MKRTLFDTYAADYHRLHASNVRISGEGVQYFAEYKVLKIHGVLNRRRKPTRRLRILDFGGGTGNSVPFFRQYFPGSSLVLLDPSFESLKLARETHPEGFAPLLFDGMRPPIRDAVFDLVLIACVLHHVPPGNHLHLLQKIRPLLKPGGDIFVFEHNPCNWLTSRVVKRCPFDAEATLIKGRDMLQTMGRAGFSGAELNYCTFFPRLLAGLRGLEDNLRRIPLGAQYYVHAAGERDGETR